MGVLTRSLGILLDRRASRFVLRCGVRVRVVVMNGFRFVQRMEHGEWVTTTVKVTSDVPPGVYSLDRARSVDSPDAKAVALHHDMDQHSMYALARDGSVLVWPVACSG